MKRVTEEEFLARVQEKLGEEYKVLGKYKNTNTKVRMQHLVCGHIYEVKPSKIFTGQRCPACRPQRIAAYHRLSHEAFLARFTDILGDDYEALDTYCDQTQHMKIKHKVCGNTYITTPVHIYRGHGCVYCNGGIRKKPEVFEAEVKDITNDEYKLITPCISSKRKIEFLHTKCGRTFYMTPEKFLFGERCPLCQHSRGEDKIDYFLRRHSILFKRQYTFNDCCSDLERGNNLLKFDFAVFNQHAQLQFLIEYDGEQHFIPAHNFGGKETFERTRRNDEIKNNYCERNNIRLLRIPYYDIQKIDSILTDYFNKENLIC